MKLKVTQEFRSKGTAYHHDGWLIEGYVPDGEFVVISSTDLPHLLERAMEMGVESATLTQLIDQ